MADGYFRTMENPFDPEASGSSVTGLQEPNTPTLVINTDPRPPTLKASKSTLRKKAVMDVKAVVSNTRHQSLAYGKKDRFDLVNERFLASMTRLFHAFDEDSNGRIDPSELLNVLQTMGYHIDHETLLEMLHELGFDKPDQSAGLNVGEFRLLISLWMTTAQYKVFHKDRQGSPARVTAFLNDAYWRWPWLCLLHITVVYFFISTFSAYMYLPDILGNILRTLLPYDIVLTAVLFAEIFMRFRIGVLQNDRFCDTQKEITKNYLRGWLAFDVFTSMPWHLFLLGIPQASLILRHLRLLLVFRVSSWIAPSRQMPMSAKYIQFHYSFLPNAQLLMCLVCVVYACAMVHYAIASDVPRLEVGLTECLLRQPRSFASSIYWSLYIISSVGLGDINPVTTSERLLYAFGCLLSLMINGYFVGSVVTRLQEADVKQNIQNRLVQLQAVLKFFDVPKALEAEILQFEDHSLSHNVILTYQDVVEMLPPEMRQNMNVYCRVPLLQNVKLLKEVHSSTLVRIATVLHSVTSAPEQFVAISGEENSSLFIIAYGFVDVLESNGEYISTINRGYSFGERGLLCEGQVYTQSFKALTYCDLCALDRDEFWKICEEHPKFGGMMQAKADNLEVYDIPSPKRKEHRPPSFFRRTSIPIAEVLPTLSTTQSKRMWKPSAQLANNGFIVEDVENIPAGCVFYSGPSANRTIQAVRESEGEMEVTGANLRSGRRRKESNVVSIERARRSSHMQLPGASRAESVFYEKDELPAGPAATSPSPTHSDSPTSSFIYAEMNEEALWTTLIDEMEQVRQLTTALCGSSRKTAVRVFDDAS